MKRLLRVTLLCLALSAAAPGLQASVSPSGFYSDFPLGLAWVEYLPPYNEHLIRDVGGFYLAFAILFAWAAVTLQRALIVPLVAAWSLAALLHAVYHVLHLDDFDAADAVAQTASLVSVLALPLLALALTRQSAQGSRSSQSAAISSDSSA